MKPGKQPTPTETLKLRGSWRGKTRKGEPKPGGDPVCPAWLTGEAKEIWKRMVPGLKKSGVMAKVDSFAFARYCLYAVLWLKELSNPGRTEATLERYANQLYKLEQSFGLQPSARARLDVNAGEEDKKDEKSYSIKFG